MKGDISVQSAVGKGSEFMVQLPLAKTELVTKKTSSTEKQAAPDLNGVKVLLAEDNAVNRQIFLAMMKPTGAQIELAFDGQQAIDKVAQYHPDVIFMDIQMPNVDGIEACKSVRESHPQTPIYALTANVMQADVETYEQAGFAGHLGKPLDMSKLYSTLNGIFSTS